MVDWDGLENRCASDGTVGSNPTLSSRNHLLTLRDVPAAVPGITFGVSEGGDGDSINLRGCSASNEITQGGGRDSAQYSRTDPFDLQQIEVYNGVNSVFNGSSSVGGTINIVSKVRRAHDLTIIGGGAGTDNYHRGTIGRDRGAPERPIPAPRRRRPPRTMRSAPRPM